MIGLSLGLGIGQQVTAAGGGGLSAPTGTATMTQLAAANRVYQRSTLTGGGQSKGQGTIPVAFSAVTVAGTIHARCSSGGGTRGDLQSEFAAATIGSTGAQTVNVSGVDARLGRFYLDILDSSGTWQNGTVLVGMGRVIGASGQSLAVRMFGRQDSETATNASLSVTINSNSSCYASYYDTNANASPTWATPADGSQYNSTFCAEYLNREVIAAGVNCALIGHSKGATSITAYIPGGAENAELRTRLDNSGGFEAFIWMQGHTDSSNGMAQATYQSNLDTLFTDITAHNAARGSSYEKYIATLPNIGTDSWGVAVQRNAIRAAGRAWAAANGAISVEPMDLPLVADTVHESQAGAIVLADHFYRASRPSLGLSHNDNGPAFTGSRSGATITLTPSFSSGGTALSAAGTPNNRVSVSTKGGFAQMPVTSFTVNSGNIVIVLTTAPAANDPLDISFDHHKTAGANGSTDMIFDNGTDGDGLSTGRAINPTFLTPIAVAAPTPSSGPTLTAGGTALYGTGASGFGNCLDGSGGFYAKGATSGLGDDGIPYSDTYTVEARFKLAAAPGAISVIFSGAGVWLGVGTDGKLTGTAGNGGLNGTTVVSNNAWHHVRMVSDGANVKVYLDGVVEGNSTPFAISPSTGTFAIGALGTGGSFQFGGLIDEFASFTTALNSGTFTPPSAPYVGNEAGLYTLYHLNSALTSG